MRPARAEVNLRRGLLRLGMALAVAWFVLWTFVYVLRPTTEGHRDVPPLPRGTVLALIGAGLAGGVWAVSGFRPR